VYASLKAAQIHVFEMMKMGGSDQQHDGVRRKCDLNFGGFRTRSRETVYDLFRHNSSHDQQ
jgi:hypothetical protein